jgi:hypothetical protein
MPCGPMARYSNTHRSPPLRSSRNAELAFAELPATEDQYAAVSHILSAPARRRGVTIGSPRNSLGQLDRSAGGML